MSKKVLIISYSFPPDNVPAAQRPYFMAKEMANRGYVPYILTAENSNSALGASEWADISLLNVIRTRVRKIPFIEDNLRAATRAKASKENKQHAGLFKNLKKRVVKIVSYLMIPDKGILWMPSGLKAAKDLVSKYDFDFIYSTSPSMVNHMIANRLKKNTSLKWVADLRDFYYLHGRENLNSALRRSLDLKLEQMVMGNANHITFISDSMKTAYVSRYPFIGSKSSVIYNGVDKSFLMEDKEKLRSSSVLKIFYAGSFYEGARSPFPLLKALDVLLESGRIQSEEFKITIAGNLPENLLSTMDRFASGSSVEYLGPIPRKDALEHMNTSHLLWLIVGEEKAHSLGFPVKGYEYIGSRRPVLVFAPENSEAKNILNDLEFGVLMTNSLKDDDARINAERIGYYFAKFKSGELDNPLDYDLAKLRKFERGYQGEQLVNLFNKLADSE